jgi:hypothetical protein
MRAGERLPIVTRADVVTAYVRSDEATSSLIKTEYRIGVTGATILRTSPFLNGRCRRHSFTEKGIHVRSRLIGNLFHRDMPNMRVDDCLCARN